MVKDRPRRAFSAGLRPNPTRVFQRARSYLEYYTPDVDTAWQYTGEPPPEKDSALYDPERGLVARVEADDPTTLGLDSQAGAKIPIVSMRLGAILRSLRPWLMLVLNVAVSCL